MPLSEYRYRAPKNSSASAIWLAAENIQKIHLFLFSKLAKVWLKDGPGMDDQEERMKNKKYKSLKMLCVICYMLCEICYTQYVTWYIYYVIYYMLYFISYMLCFISYMLNVKCYMWYMLYTLR